MGVAGTHALRKTSTKRVRWLNSVNLLNAAAREVFIIDPYIDEQMFDLYARSIDRTVKFRLITNLAKVKDQKGIVAAAKIYAAGGNFSPIL
jgi:hypothetical protein